MPHASHAPRVKPTPSPAAQAAASASIACLADMRAATAPVYKHHINERPLLVGPACFSHDYNALCDRAKRSAPTQRERRKHSDLSNYIAHAFRTTRNFATCVSVLCTARGSADYTSKISTAGFCSVFPSCSFLARVAARRSCAAYVATNSIRHMTNFNIVT